MPDGKPLLHTSWKKPAPKIGNLMDEEPKLAITVG